MAADVAALEAAMPPPPPPAPVVSPEALARLPAGSVRTLAATDDGERKSWIEKLGLVAAMLQSNADVDEVTLAALGAYLRWLGTCETRCGEDSGSRSMAAASLLARDAFVALESPHVRTPAARALARRVHPWLPSISAEFAGDNANVLRDAALRLATSRDVSASFRAEFEAQVQVPLARNVGPAALVAAERLAASAARGEVTQSQAAREDVKEFAERLARYFNRAPALDRLGRMPWRRSTKRPEAIKQKRRMLYCALSARSPACASCSCGPSRRLCLVTRRATPCRGGRRTAWRSFRWRSPRARC